MNNGRLRYLKSLSPEALTIHIKQLETVRRLQEEAALARATERYNKKPRTTNGARKLRAEKTGLYDKLLEEQDGKCAICTITFIETPAIDHNHETGNIRGLLCRGCNIGLGHFKDDPLRLSKAIEYLSREGTPLV